MDADQTARSSASPPNQTSTGTIVKAVVPRWKRWLRRVLIASAGVLVFLLLSSWWVSHQTQQVPEFYQRAVVVLPPEQLAESSEQLEADVEKLQADVKRRGAWEASFEVEQINAWLADQLPKRYPDLQAKGLAEPRIMIEDGTMHAAARIDGNRIKAVVSCELSVQLTDQPNQLAIVVGALRAGALPLPVSQFQGTIQRLLKRTKLDLKWETLDGQTVALIQVPSEYPGYSDKPVVIESIDLSSGQLRVIGQSGSST